MLFPSASLLFPQFPAPPQPQTIINVLCVPRVLPVLDVSCDWNRTLCGLCNWLLPLRVVFQGSSMWWHVSEPHSFLRLSHTPLRGRSTFCPHPFISWQTFGLLPLLIVMNNEAVNMHIRLCGCVWTCAFVSLGKISRSRVAASYGDWVLNAFRNCQTLFQSRCTILRFHQPCSSVPVSPHPCRQLEFFGRFVYFLSFWLAD